MSIGSVESADYSTVIEFLRESLRSGGNLSAYEKRFTLEVLKDAVDRLDTVTGSLGTGETAAGDASAAVAAVKDAIVVLDATACAANAGADAAAVIATAVTDLAAVISDLDDLEDDLGDAGTAVDTPEYVANTVADGG
jgi:hypothetical protein